MVVMAYRSDRYLLREYLHEEEACAFYMYSLFLCKAISFYMRCMALLSPASCYDYFFVLICRELVMTKMI